ncbi:hypothetical protein Tco_0267805 [Tanacetum coccineum]
MSNTNTNLQTQTSSVLQNDTVSSCSISKVQEKTQLSRIEIMTDSTVQDDSSRSGNDTDADDADIRPIYDEEPMAKVGGVINDQYPENMSSFKSPCLIHHLITRPNEYSKQSPRSPENILLKETVA